MSTFCAMYASMLRERAQYRRLRFISHSIECTRLLLAGGAGARGGTHIERVRHAAVVFDHVRRVLDRVRHQTCSV